MNVISSSYGNDSIALIQWAYEKGLKDVVVVYVDTGWATKKWEERILAGEALAGGYGFQTVRCGGDMKFEELIQHKKGFPNQRFQWCSGMLKGIPFLNWIDEIDKDRKAKVMVGKRREESRERAKTPEYVYDSDYHGGRTLWHPLYLHNETDRNLLLEYAGFDVLPHRSLECSPCVNANRNDFQMLCQTDIEKVKNLENKVGKNMFRPARHNGAIGIVEVVKWAKYGAGKYIPDQEDMFDLGCGSPFGCGL